MPGGITGVRLPVDDENADEPWKMTPSRRRQGPAVKERCRNRSTSCSPIRSMSIGPTCHRHWWPSWCGSRPFRTPSSIAPRPCGFRPTASRGSSHVPSFIRATSDCRADAWTRPSSCSSRMAQKRNLKDERHAGRPLDVKFLGTLHDVQAAAVAAIEPHDYGVLAATTAFGKTVVGARMIAARGVNTLVLVHRRQLVDQWRERLRTFLSVQDGDIGTIGGGKRKPTGRIDIALIQSLVRNGEVSDLVADYGHLIVDECHHLSAVSFELVARRSKARYVLGLSATVARKDGHHPIIFMQCGPVRYRVDAKSQAATRSFSHKVRLRETGFRLAAGSGDTGAIADDRALCRAGPGREAQRPDLRRRAAQPGGRSPARDPDRAARSSRATSAHGSRSSRAIWSFSTAA